MNRKFIALFVSLLCCSTLHAAESRPEPHAGPKSDRLWLPASAAHLRPFLEMAVEEAQYDSNCAEVLYARLNEYRTIYEEPTFTVLCKKDYRTTFNKVYPITYLDPDYNARIAASEAASANAEALTGDINSIRDQLIAPTAFERPTPAPQAPAPAAVDPVRVLAEDPNDLSLDLQIEPEPTPPAPPDLQ